MKDTAIIRVLDEANNIVRNPHGYAPYLDASDIVDAGKELGAINEWVAACDNLICVVGEIRDAMTKNAAPVDLKHALKQVDTVTIDAALILDLIRKFEALPNANPN